MSITIICDRCKIESHSSEEPFVKLLVTTYRDEKRWDLCPYCYEKFVLHFMSNSRVEADAAKPLQSTGGLR